MRQKPERLISYTTAQIGQDKVNLIRLQIQHFQAQTYHELDIVLHRHRTS